MHVRNAGHGIDVIHVAGANTTRDLLAVTAPILPQWRIFAVAPAPVFDDAWLLPASPGAARPLRRSAWR